MYSEYVWLAPGLLSGMELVSVVIMLIMVVKTEGGVMYSAPYTEQRRYTNQLWFTFYVSSVGAACALGSLLVTPTPLSLYTIITLAVAYGGVLPLAAMALSLYHVTAMEWSLRGLKEQGFPWGR